MKDNEIQRTAPEKLECCDLQVQVVDQTTHPPKCHSFAGQSAPVPLRFWYDVQSLGHRVGHTHTHLSQKNTEQQI